MKRRELLSRMVMASVAAGVAPLSFPLRALAAECPVAPPTMPRTLVNVMLNGGADLRFLFMPAPQSLSTEHEQLMFESRKQMYASSRDSDTATYADMFTAEYIKPTEGSAFGIHKSSGWLVEQYKANNVAIIANAYCSRNRRHDQSILNADAGEPNFNQLVYERDGWGGRLVEAIGTGANAVELGNSISVFNKGSEDGNRLAQVIHAKNVRDIALPTPGAGATRRDAMVRALSAYYEARGNEVIGEKPTEWPYHTFFDHNAAFRAFGDGIAARMADCGALPDGLASPANGGSFDLFNSSFEQQCRNLYDVCLAPDLFNVRTLSMSYGGWDTHGNEEVRISRNLGDIFGLDQGLDSATTEIRNIGTQSEKELVFYFASDFGRQIVTNGDYGTDHGKGTYAILVGDDVKGGIYGKLFPESEATENGGKIPLLTHGDDIFGETSTENVLAEVCEWMEPSSSGTVFDNLYSGNVEDEVSLSGLLSD